MRKTLLLFLVLFASLHSLAQNVGIGTATPNASAQLDISSNTKGILIPRMTDAEKIAIPSPAQGLLIFNTTTNSFQYFNSAVWINVSNSGIITGTANKVAKFNSPWGLTPGMLTDNGLGVSLNNAATVANASAILDISSNNKGVLLPRTSTTTRTGIINPAKGLLIYDTTTSSFWYHNGTAWVEAVSAGNNWFVNGNTGLTDVVNFIGTSDNIPLNFRVNNEKAGRIDHINGNAFFGHQSGNSNTIGQLNTAIGEQALFSNVNASFNTAIGYFALRYDTGYFNTAIGFQSLYVNTGGIKNTATGAQSLSTNSTGNENTATGNSAMNDNTTGNYNTATGSLSLSSNINGNNNSALGYQALLLNTSGSDNIAIGVNALIVNQSGYCNVAVGPGSLFSNSTGHNSVAIGDSALFHFGGSNNSSNTAIGSKALFNSSGAANTATGFHSLYSTTSGTDNTANGQGALESNISGSSNVAAGSNALSDNTTGNLNVAVGHMALSLNTTGNNNVGVGQQALFSTNSGSGNIGIGSITSTGAFGQNNIVIGGGGGTNSNSLTNAIALGVGTIVNASNKVRIGNSSVNVIEGQVAFSFPSDGRFKYNISDDGVKGLDFIIRLRPVNYQFDTKKYDAFIKKDMPAFTGSKMISEKDYQLSSSMVHTGFIAQEVEQAAKQSHYIFDGLHRPESENDNYSLAYSQFVVPLVKAVQEQQVQIEQLKKQNLALQLQNAEIKKKQEEIEKRLILLEN